ncbi:MAG TPA: sugar-binding domain-containing protein [Bryobacteraceae bacterium]|jgi:DNA-binding transcriptional regulator LsrR (DeoR family)
MYFIDGKTKLEISKALFMDARKVTQLLKEAQEQKLVRIYIPETVGETYSSLLVRRFPHLQRVFVVPALVPTQDPRAKEKERVALLQRIGITAADYLEEINGADNNPLHVGIGGGETLFEFVMALPERERNMDVHALMVVGRGDTGDSPTHPDASINASLLWSKCGRQPRRCRFATMTPYAPKIAKGQVAEYFRAQLKQLADNPKVKAVVRALDNLDVAFTSLLSFDSPETDPQTMLDLLAPAVTLDDLMRQGAVADMSYCLFDSEGTETPRDPDGKPISKDSWRFFLTPGHYSGLGGVAFYKKMVEDGKKVVVLAGPSRVAGLKAALRGKLFNVLITDEGTARELTKP